MSTKAELTPATECCKDKTSPTEANPSRLPYKDLRRAKRTIMEKVPPITKPLLEKESKGENTNQGLRAP